MKLLAALAAVLVAVALCRRTRPKRELRRDEDDVQPADPYVASLAADADWPDAARAGLPTRAFSGSSPDSGGQTLRICRCPVVTGGQVMHQPGCVFLTTVPVQWWVASCGVAHPYGICNDPSHGWVRTRR